MLKLVLNLQLNEMIQLQRVVELIGGEASCVLYNKIAILDKVSKMSRFAENAVSITENAVELGRAISEVSCIVHRGCHCLTPGKDQ